MFLTLATEAPVHKNPFMGVLSMNQIKMKIVVQTITTTDDICEKRGEPELQK